MTITPQQKILKVLQLIRELSQLGIPSEPVDIEVSDLREAKVSAEDFARVIKKLTSEGLVSDNAHEVIQLDGRLTYRHEIAILDAIKFVEYADRLHSTVHSDIDRLLGDKFLAIADVLYDVYGQLQVSSGSEIYIDIVPQVVRFPNLFPTDSVSMRDRYGDLRMEAVRYLLDRNIFSKTELIRGDHRWESRVKIMVDRIPFQSFCDRFWEVYAKRVKEEEAPDSDHSKPDNPTRSIPNKEEAATTHIHIHNQNNAVQSLNVPGVHTQEEDEPKQLNISLKHMSVEFDDNAAQIKIGSQTCQLPSFKNEHFFCRAVFQYIKDEPIDWSLIYEKMTGKEPVKSDDSEKMSPEQRSVYDAMNAVNNRVMQVINTKDKLFSWSEKTVTRRF